MTSGIGLGRASTLSRGPTTRISSPPPPDTSPVQFEHPPPWVELAKVVEQQPQSAAALAVVVLALTIGWIGWRTFIYISLLVAGPLAVWFVFPRAAERPPLDEWPPAASDHDSVAWVYVSACCVLSAVVHLCTYPEVMLTTSSNHALRSLFPLVSTDLLRPFVDLLEDALMTQVPPVVVSDIRGMWQVVCGLADTAPRHRFVSPAYRSASSRCS
jgi:hypothetical protein